MVDRAEERAQGAEAAGTNRAPGAAQLVASQTIGLAVILVLLFLFLPSESGSRLAARLPALRRGVDAVLHGLAAPEAIALAGGIVAGALMIGWNVLFQSLFRKTDHRIGEPRFGGTAARAAAAYLVPVSSFNEEVIFRGWVFSLVEARFGAAAALGGSALLFALVHTEKGIHGRATVFVYGLVLGTLWLLTGSLWACILAHGVVNGAAFFLPRREERAGGGGAHG